MSLSALRSFVMLLREPEGNAAHLLNNGNVPLQQQQQTWSDKTDSSDVNNKQINSDDSDTLSLTCREHQLREALEKSVELDINNSSSDFLVYNSNQTNQGLNKANSNNLTLDFNDDVTSLNPTIFDYSPDEGLFDYEDDDRSYSSTNTSQTDDEKMLENSVSDDSYTNDTSFHIPRGIHNPNYPGFQHLAYTLQDYLIESPGSYDNIEISDNQIEYDDRFMERLEEIRKYDEKTDSERIIEQNNNNYEVDSTYCVSKDNDNTTKLSDGLSYYATDTKKIILHNSKPKNVITSDSEKIILNCSDKNDNILSVVLRSEKELSVVNSKCSDNEMSEMANVDIVTKNDNSDFQDDLLELKKEIYESIQKPIATTLENISEVVNNVIQCFSEDNDEVCNFSINNTCVQELIGKSIKKLHEETNSNLSIVDHIEVSNQINDNNNVEDVTSSSILDKQSESNNEIVDQIKTHMNDAYMSNVTENLFPENNIEKAEKELEEKSEQKQNYDINFNKKPDKDESIQSLVKENNTHPVQINKNFIKFDKYKTKSRCETVKKSSISKENSQNSINRNNVQSKSCDRKSSHDLGAFDVYNIETAMPLIDLDAIENHLRAAREEERRRRNDREEIRRRLAMGTEQDEYYSVADRPGRKPSLQARLQSGMNLQICFMNETASDTESPSDVETNNPSPDKIPHSNSKYKNENFTPVNNSKKSEKPAPGVVRPNSLALNDFSKNPPTVDFTDKIDFFECQARLQTEARMALAQAKEIAHMQMEMERQRQQKSPITEMLRSSLEKAGVQFPGDRRRVSRQMLTDINVAQLQVIVNELHTQIEYLNETLVELLIARDELHMGQDSMLVDIEDLTRHLGAKDVPSKKTENGEKNHNGGKNNNNIDKNMQIQMQPLISK